jgi:hypothetical protein
LDEIYGKLQGAHVSRTRSDTKLASGEMPVKLPRKMKKLASSKSAFAYFEEEDIVETRRPAIVREGKVGVMEGDDEVDAKADDFIMRSSHPIFGQGGGWSHPRFLPPPPFLIFSFFFF